jgi:mono/diheme cytochrome c family protein
MRESSSHSRYALILVACLLTSLPALARADAQVDEAAARDNPLAFDIAAIKRGRQFYTVHCVRCHGVDGRGDTEMREFLKTAPADLTDEPWLYGAGDGAMFDVISAGRTERDMPAYDELLDEASIWQVIHYVRYLGGKRP